jgi:thiamine biosynthesis protein ThiI
MKLLALVSGGIDSPVAAWRMRQLGHEVSFVHFHNYTPQQAAVRQKVIDLVKVVGGGRLWMVPFRNIQLEVVKNVPAKYRMIVYRRLMHMIAGELAMKEEAAALVTGDNLAQVASQTLDNMFVINAASPLPVLRPLLGAEKNDTVNTAKRIGTYELSIQPYSDCCTFMVAERPETHAELSMIEQLEKGMDMQKLVTEAVTAAELVEVE